MTSPDLGGIDNTFTNLPMSFHYPQNQRFVRLTSEGSHVGRTFPRDFFCFPQRRAKERRFAKRGLAASGRGRGGETGQRSGALVPS